LAGCFFLLLAVVERLPLLCVIADHIEILNREVVTELGLQSGLAGDDLLGCR